MAASMMAGCKHDGGLQGESGDLSALFVQKAASIYIPARARGAREDSSHAYFFADALARGTPARARAHGEQGLRARVPSVRCMRLCHSVRDCARVCGVRSRAFACVCVRACVRASERAKLCVRVRESSPHC